MYLVTIKKVVQESYIIALDESGTPATKDKALRMASLYAQMSETKIRSHASGWDSRVGNSQSVLGIRNIEIKEIN